MIIAIDVISDVICPWCYIGKRRLERAIALAECGDVRVRWHPFQLNPHIPKAGMNRKEYRSAKFGSWERSLALDTQVAAAGLAEGIAFAFDKIERTPNTLDAHRLIGLAGEDGAQDAVVEAVFRAYFAEGKDITDVAILLNVVEGAGLDRSRAEALLNSDEGMGAIRTAEQQARRAGVQGVPFFIINERLALTGAREPREFLVALKEVGASSGDEQGVCEIGPGPEPSC
jgi:predicted DsbA family dithiol-disulfide isomerase